MNRRKVNFATVTITAAWTVAKLAPDGQLCDGSLTVAKFTLRQLWQQTSQCMNPSGRISLSTSAASRRFAARPKTKPKDSSGNNEDPEQAKLWVGFNSTIKREKPNVKWTDIMRLEGTKQALQEAVILPVKFPQFFTGGLVWFSVRRLSPVEFG
ncbi:hypothetical protein Fmac_001344 [Flemingia macrophylla]|uniref:Uncharacterized protein n=1 Tax=Flemingia macrophylla TaxID=520843 RepID=A0ABD1NGV1_9FABA